MPPASAPCRCGITAVLLRVAPEWLSHDGTTACPWPCPPPQRTSNQLGCRRISSRWAATLMGGSMRPSAPKRPTLWARSGAGAAHVEVGAAGPAASPVASCPACGLLPLVPKGLNATECCCCPCRPGAGAWLELELNTQETSGSKGRADVILGYLRRCLCRAFVCAGLRLGVHQWCA